MKEKLKAVLGEKEFIELQLWMMDNKGKILASLNEYARKGRPVFIGDSIVEGFALEEFFDEKIYNRGVGGDTSKQMRDRYPSVALPLAPSALLIWVGTNDIASGFTAEESVANIAAVVEQTRALLPDTKFYLLSIAPTNERCKDEYVRLSVSDRTNEKIRLHNEAYRKYAAENDVTFVDFYDDLLVDGELPMNETYDGLHPNGKGYLPVVKKLKEYFA